MRQHGGKSLTDMTISEIMSLQAKRSGMSNQEWIRQGRLHAVGRYQFIGGTLPGVVSRSGIPTNAKFTPEVQDLLALQYLKEAGIGAWIGPSDKATRGERQIIEAARKEPINYKPSISSGQQPNPIPPPPAPPSAAPRPPAQTSGTFQLNPQKRIALESKVQDTIKSDYYKSRGGSHLGIDLACPVGTYIACRLPCKVMEARYESGYGYYTDIIIPSLNIRLRFAHLSSQLIKSGDVPAGKPFARSGNSGAKTTGPHIHMDATRNMGGTAYGGDLNPDPYVDAMIFSKTPPQGFVAPSTPSTPTPAQITSSGTQQRRQASQQLAQQQAGPSIIIIEEEPPAQQPQGSIGGGGAMMIPLIINPLNSFITKKLLLDLAYT